jgi:hypothetical protein
MSEREKAIAYIRYRHRLFLSKGLAVFIALMDTLFAVLLFLGDATVGALRLLAIILLGFQLVHIIVIALLLVSDKDDLLSRIVRSAATYTFMFVEWSLMALLFGFLMSGLNISDAPVMLIATLPVVLAAFVFIDFRLTITRISLGYYVGRPSKPPVATTALFATVIIAEMFRSVFLPQLSLWAQWVLLVICYVVMVGTMTHGVTWWLRVYYIKKYNISESSLEDR